MNTITNATNFVKTVFAKLTGDKSQEIALRNYKQASAAVNGEISDLQRKLVDQEQTVEDLKEALENAKYPSERIEATLSGKREYLNGIKNAQKALETALDAVVETNEAIYFAQRLQEEFDSEGSLVAGGQSAT